jgi:hypothetical protein
MPKCPMCLFGFLAAVGATGLERALGLDPQVLLGISLVMLAFVVVCFAVRRGLIGAAAAMLASVFIFCGKHVFSSTALVVCGLTILATYVLGDSLISPDGTHLLFSGVFCGFAASSRLLCGEVLRGSYRAHLE